MNFKNCYLLFLVTFFCSWQLSAFDIGQAYEEVDFTAGTDPLSQAASQVAQSLVNVGGTIIHGAKEISKDLSQKAVESAEALKEIGEKGIEAVKNSFGEDKKETVKPGFNIFGEHLPTKKSLAALYENVKRKFGEISISKQQIQGALLVITCAGVTYVLYKDGTLNKIGGAVKKNKGIVLSALGALSLIGASVYAYQYNHQ